MAHARVYLACLFLGAIACRTQPIDGNIDLSVPRDAAPPVDQSVFDAAMVDFRMPSDPILIVDHGIDHGIVDLAGHDLAGHDLATHDMPIVDLAIPHDLASHDLSVHDLAVPHDLAVHDLASSSDLSTCSTIAGNWTVVQVQSHASGCALASNCGFGGNPACGVTSAATVTHPTATSINWNYAVFAPLGNFGGTINAAHHFTTSNSSLGASTFTGDITASCHMTGVITLNFGGCMATINVTGTHN